MCQAKKPSAVQSSCFEIQNLTGKEYLDQSFLEAIDRIEISAEHDQKIDNMVLVRGGRFEMGGDWPEIIQEVPPMSLPQGDEFPKHTVQISDFYMDEHEVTIGQYLEFVNATGYVTVAEKDVDWEMIKKQLPPDTPKPDDELLKAGALVFNYAAAGATMDDMANWWSFVRGANWRRPHGKELSLDSVKNYPVTQVSWYDAMAYARWVGKRLPTEAEYEYAMRGGDNGTIYPWGNEKLEHHSSKGNFWQGNFPYKNIAADGFEFLAPVMSFTPNKYGLYDIAGNVWEWTLDWYSPLYYQELSDNQQPAINPQGPGRSTDMYMVNAMNKVIRGGSYLCNDSWCSGYRNARRMRVTPDSGMGHLGFRLVRDAL